ncbi:putative reverse transcriptase domain-containing protein [Tanacetum coccineum]
MTPESIQAMIDQAIQRNSTHTQDDRSQSSGGGIRRPVQPTCVCSYTDFMKCQPLNFKGTEGVVGLSQWLKKMELVFHISGCAIDNQGTLKKKLMDKYCPKGKIKKLEIELWNLKVRGNDVTAYTQRFQELALICTKFLADKTEKVDKYISGLPNNIHGNVMTARPKTLDDAIELANDLMDQKLRTYAERQNDNKKKADDSSRNNEQQQQHKKQNVARTYTVGSGEKKAYTGNIPLCTKCNYHHTRQCAPKCGNCKRYGHATSDCRVNTNNNKNRKAGACYECGNTGHIKRNCLKLKNRRNGNGNGVAQGRAYALGGGDDSPDSNVITGTFPLNNRYASILFDTCADRSCVSTTFSALINITSTTLENHYDIELADRKIIGVKTIIRGCTLNFMNHPFNIDLMPVPLSSFDIIIGMDWLTKYHGVIICNEKIVRVPFGKDTPHKYLSKGCDIFLAHITTKEAKDKSEGKRLKDVSIVRDFPEVFHEDLPGIPPARQVEFRIDLIPDSKGIHVDPAKIESIKDWRILIGLYSSWSTVTLQSYGPVHIITARKRVGPLPTHRLAVRHLVGYYSSDPFTSDDSSETSSDSSSDDLFNSSSSHSSSDHSSLALPSVKRSSHQLCSLVSSIPHSSAAITKRSSHPSYASPSRKRSRSPTTSVPRSSPILGALSPTRADLLPPPKRIRKTSLRDDVVVRGSDEPHLEHDIDSEIQAEIDECIAYADALKASGIDPRVAVEAVDQEDIKTCTRGPVEVRVERVTHPTVPDDIPEPAQEEGAVKVTYETLGDLGHKIVATGQQRAILLERISELETMTNTRSGATMTREVVNELVDHRVAEALEARDATRNLEPLVESGGNGNGNNNGNGYNFGGLMPVARECLYQGFLKCQPLDFNGTEGVVGLTRWFKKMETVFHISNCPQKYQVKYATCTLLNSALT